MGPLPIVLALTLVVPAVSAAQTSTQRTQKQRRAGKAPVGQELEAQPPAGLEQPSAMLERSRAVQQPPAAPAVAPQRAGTTATSTAFVRNPEPVSTTLRIERGARRVGLPTVLPPFTGPTPPASPTR
jgi:hypothetical protein